MKPFCRVLILTIAVAISSNFAFAEPFNNELKIHIITPRYRLDWKSPRSILVTSLLNYLKKDYAPIGHFVVDLKCSAPNQYGISHIRTGMTGAENSSNRGTILKKKLGLGSVLYSFPGDLQSVENADNGIELARKDNRLTTVVIPTSASRCKKAMEFLDHWIAHGSYTVYGGNMDVAAGEGSGCADFALEFFRVATSVTPKDDLMARVRLPSRLVGDGLVKKVPFSKILLAGKWSRNPEDTLYVTPDTNKVIDFVRKGAMKIDDHYTYIRHLGLEDESFLLSGNIDDPGLNEKIELKAGALAPYEVENFDFKFGYQRREPVLDTWKRVAVE